MKTRSFCRRPCGPVIFLILFPACVGVDYVDDVAATAEPSVAVEASKTSLLLGMTLQLSATYTDATGVAYTAAAADIEWRSSDDTRLSVDATGLAIAEAAGQVEVRALVQDLTSPPLLLTVVADNQAVASVTISGVPQRLEVAATAALTAVAKTVDDVVVAGLTATWLSSDDSVVSVQPSGLATAHTGGMAAITATVAGVRSPPVALTVNVPGTFVGVDHELVGTAEIVVGTDGGLILELKDGFNVNRGAGGPDLRVLLSQGSSPTADRVDLGRLTSATGDQSYALPPGLTVNSYAYVIIYCVSFSSNFGYARLLP